MKKESTNTALGYTIWVAKFVLAALFLMAGVMKTTQPIEALHQTMSWTTAVPELMVRLIGLSELLGAIGLVLPSVLNIKPSLTPIAALSLATVQLLAAGFHIARGEWSFIAFNLVLGLISLFVWWGRTKKLPVQPRIAR